MGVYIKGMEMPTRCAECRLFGKYGCPLICAVGENCPLIEVPEPHGRLIDADAMCEGRVRNDNVVICAKCAPTVILASEEGMI